MRFAYATGARPLDGFTIKRGIGLGGFGEVYFAVSDAGKEVALKRIQRNLDIEIRGVSQCLNLKHPNLISLFDIRYDDEGQGWVVMEYVAGESLKDVIERNPNGLPEGEVLAWFRGIAPGVAYLHDHGIVHRDLKPGNIFRDHDTVKIGDYGLSKFISCSRRSGQTESVGTFHYMAPEIGKGVYGKEIDVYALGIILFELLTGRVPFEGESSQEIMMKHLTADPDLTPVPDAYRAIIERAMAKDPLARYADVNELLRCVEAAAGRGNAAAWTSAAAPAGAAPLYIGDDGSVDEGIYLGPVRERPGTQASPPSAAGVAPPEPIAQAIRQGWRSLRSSWRQSNLNTPLKILILTGGALLLLVNAHWLVPLGAVLGSLYLVYLGIFLLVRSGHPRQAATASQSAPTRTAQVAAPQRPVPPQPAPAPGRRRGLSGPRTRWQDVARQQFRARTPSERLGELSGSLLMAALVACVSSLILLLGWGGLLEGGIEAWSTFAWLASTSVVAAWTVLPLARRWASREGEQVHRRFAMLVAGLFVGLASYAIGDFLGVRLGDELAVASLQETEAGAGMFGRDGTPKLSAFLVYFAALFALVRWWLQGDPLRTTRLSLWATAGCVLCAGIVHLFWPFPQPWGFMLVVSTSAAVQLSAPWLPDRERSRIRRQVMEA